MATATDVAAFAGRSDDAEFVAAATAALPLITGMVKAYTRGKGFDTLGNPADDLDAVIVTSCARLANNPVLEHSESIGDYRVEHTEFTGWTLAELAILNRYRKRAA